MRQSGRPLGRFRSFLLASMQHFLANEWRSGQAKKRGGDRRVVSFDVSGGESRYQLEPAHETTPEKIYERRWAMTILDRALSKLREDYVASGKEELFENLKGCLGGKSSPVSYSGIAERLGLTEGAIKVAVHRLRRRCRERLREEIAQTVAQPEEIEAELRELFAALAS